VKRVLFLVCLFALCNLTLLAQTGKGLQVASTTEKSKVHVAPQAVPAGMQKIFSNLGPNQYNLYFATLGWFVTGPNVVGTQHQFISMPFTPNSNAEVTQVRLALQDTGSGGDLFYVSIYADSGGNPGTLLAGPVTLTHLPLFGTCCTLAIAKFESPLPVTGGTKYWVVASTPATGKGSDSLGYWDWVYQDDIPPVWLSDLSIELPGSRASAFEVLGTNE
jgi:hypothetical protein